MVLTNLEHHRREKAIAQFLERRRPPAHLRDEVDLECRWAGQSIEVVEVRAGWQDPAQKVERPIAKATYVSASRHWRVFWRRRGARWSTFEPQPQVPTLEAFFDVLDRDEQACFFG